MDIIQNAQRTTHNSPLPPAAAAVADAAMAISGVVAVTLGGSLASGLADEHSDVDLHVYWREPLADDAARHAALAAAADAGTAVATIREWGLEDHLTAGGRLVELVYVHLGDLRSLVERSYGEGLGDEGFATALLWSVAAGLLLRDPSGELHALRARLAAYPEATRRRLLATMPGLLRAYLGQLRKAQARGDVLFAQHRRYTIQMVYFNMLFALNRMYHPGEKRLLLHGERCAIRPPGQAERWERVARLPAGDPAAAELLAGLTDDLCALARESQ